MSLTLDDKSYEFDKLAKKYDNFMSPDYEISIDGKNIFKEGVIVVQAQATTSVSVDASNLTFTVVNAYDLKTLDFKWIKDYFTIGKKVEAKMGYGDQLATVFSGLITAVEFEFPDEGNPLLHITAMDYSYLLMKGKAKDAPNFWQEKTLTQIIKSIIGLYKLSAKGVEDSKTVLDPIDREGRDDFRLIADLARNDHWEFFCLGSDVYFRKPYQKTTAVTTLTFGKSLLSFSLRADLADQVGQYVIHGRDKEGKWIEGKSASVKAIGSNSTTGPDLVKAQGSYKLHYVYTNITNASRLQEVANAMASDSAMELLNGHGRSVGIPELIAGRFLKLDGLGSKLNQPMYLTKVTHQISRSGYFTSFEVKGNAI